MNEADRHRTESDPGEPDLVALQISTDEREVLRAGLREWGGPARCTEEFAVAMGFRSVQDLFDEGRRIGESLAAGLPLSRIDWTRALLATEVVFASNVVGSGLDWEICTGFSDGRTLELLRGLQRRASTAGVGGTVFGARPHRR